MKQWIRKWLGLSSIIQSQSDLVQYQSMLNKRFDEIGYKQDKISNQWSALAAGVGRIIAKLDPIFGTSELDPGRVAASKKLEEEIIAKLKAEAAERNKHNG